MCIILHEARSQIPSVNKCYGVLCHRCLRQIPSLGDPTGRIKADELSKATKIFYAGVSGCALAFPGYISPRAGAMQPTSSLP